MIKLINGLPTTVQPYTASIAYPSGLTANTTITLPSSGSFSKSDGSDILIIINGQVKEITRDYTTVGSTPFTQIQFGYALPNDAILHFQQVIG